MFVNRVLVATVVARRSFALLPLIISLNFAVACHAQDTLSKDAEATEIARIVLYNVNILNALHAASRVNKSNRQLSPIVDRLTALQKREAKLQAYYDRHIGEGEPKEELKIDAEMDALLQRGKPIRDRNAEAMREEGVYLMNARYLYTKLNANSSSRRHMSCDPSLYPTTYPTSIPRVLRQYDPESLPGRIVYIK